MSRRSGRPAAAYSAGVAALTAVSVVAGCTPAPEEQNLHPHAVVQTIGAHLVDPDLAPQIDAFFANDFADAYRNRRAIQVTVQGVPVAKRYNHSQPGATYDIGAVQGPILATLVGIAVHEGRLRGPDQTVYQLLPSYRTVMSPGMRSVTLGELLSMTAGLPADVSVGRPAARLSVAAILAQGPDQTPGPHFAFSPRSMAVVAEILTTAVHEPVWQYAQDRLFGPIGVRLDIVGGVIRASASDLVRLGQLWLGYGRYGGREVVPALWVGEMTRPQASTGLESIPAFGYGFWLTSADGHDAFAASGLGGQLVEVAPDLDLVVVVQSETDVDLLGSVLAGFPGATDYINLVDLVIARAVH